MRLKISLVLGILFSLILISTNFVFSQEQLTQEEPLPEIPAEPQTQWIWADALSVDTAGRKILVKYLDYDTDMEKEMSISVDDKTTYENVKSIDEIKPQDTLSIDYIISPDGSNIAKNISVEKPEGIETLPEEVSPAEPKEAPVLE